MLLLLIYDTKLVTDTAFGNSLSHGIGCLKSKCRCIVTTALHADIKAKAFTNLVIKSWFYSQNSFFYVWLGGLKQRISERKKDSKASSNTNHLINIWIDVQFWPNSLELVNNCSTNVFVLSVWLLFIFGFAHP